MMRRLAAVAFTTTVALGGLTGCGDDATQEAVDRASEAVSSAAEEAENVDLPEVDWDKYGEELRDRIDRWADEADCDRLKQALAGSRFADTEVSEYIEAQIEEAC